MVFPVSSLSESFSSVKNRADFGSGCFKNSNNVCDRFDMENFSLKVEIQKSTKPQEKERNCREDVT